SHITHARSAYNFSRSGTVCGTFSARVTADPRFVSCKSCQRMLPSQERALAPDDSAEPLKVLSVKPWWLWATIHAGKLVENRSFKTDYRGPVLLHASRQGSAADHSVCYRIVARVSGRTRHALGFLLPERERLLREYGGRVVACCTLVDCLPSTRVASSWNTGAGWCWMLEDVRELAERVPYKSKLNLHNAPADLRAELARRRLL